jgi:hypothetical protein
MDVNLKFDLKTVCQSDINQERRTSERKPVGFEVLLSEGGEDTLIMQASNISETGLFVLSEGEQRPVLGSVVQVTLNSPLKNENSPLIMLVTRMDSSGVGLKYIKDFTG